MAASFDRPGAATQSTWWTHPIIAGALAGIAGGVVFGLMMAATMPPMIGMIGSLLGVPSLGFLVHLLFSAIIGAGFGLLLGPRVGDWGSAAVYGAGYGVVWWILGPLVIMPVWMGMGVMFAQALTMPNLMSLLGHILYGLVTGISYRALAR